MLFFMSYTTKVVFSNKENILFQAKSPPSPLIPVLKKLLIAFMCAFVIFFIVPMYPASTLIGL